MLPIPPLAWALVRQDTVQEVDLAFRTLALRDPLVCPLEPQPTPSSLSTDRCNKSAWIRDVVLLNLDQVVGVVWGLLQSVLVFR